GGGGLGLFFVWFFVWAILATLLSPRLCTAKAQRIINLVLGFVMWFIALQLARDGIAHEQALFS
ncbi:LysE family transporter, partial [Escherichia coli]|uniref:LysE family transporter n=1 Tax=Escherichia coli TaxID=562 RepID=UPI0014856163